MTSFLFVSYPKALLTGLSLPMEMISSARSIARIKTRQTKKWKCGIVSASFTSTSAIKFANNIKILPDYNLSSAPQADTILIPPIWGNPESVVDKNTDLIDWMVKRYRKGANIVATGTGVCLLASAGLLNQKVATTHWYYFDTFKKKYPLVNLQKQHFITQDGRITCTGSINALVDLTLYLIGEKYGKEVSQVIEQHYGHEINRTYDKPWFDRGASRHPDENIIEVQQWMQSHYFQHFDLKSLSEQANMSTRQFSRRFKSAVGKSPLAYAVDLKIQSAQELLRETNLALQDIADQLGYKDNSYFARQFKQLTKLTPSEYREMVRGKLFSIETKH